jgi:hypothetical protein
MKSIIRENSSLYHFIQWSFFPLVLIGTPYLIYLLVGNGASVAITTYIVAVAVGLLFWIAEWLLPYKERWNHSHDHDDIANDIVSGTVAYVVLPIFLKPLFIALLAGGTVWLSTQWGGAIWPSEWPVISSVHRLPLYYLPTKTYCPELIVSVTPASTVSAQASILVV